MQLKHNSPFNTWIYTYIHIQYQCWLSERFKVYLSNTLRGLLTTDNTKMERIPANQLKIKVLREKFLAKIIVLWVYVNV